MRTSRSKTRMTRFSIFLAFWIDLTIWIATIFYAMVKLKFCFNSRPFKIPCLTDWPSSVGTNFPILPNSSRLIQGNFNGRSQLKFIRVDWIGTKKVEMVVYNHYLIAFINVDNNLDRLNRVNCKWKRYFKM